MPLWTWTLVADHQRALRYRRGRLVRWLEPGRHLSIWPGAGDRDELVDLDAGVLPHRPELEAVLPPGVAEVLEVPHRSFAIVELDGRPTRALTAGRYLLLQARARVTARVWSTVPLRAELPPDQWALVPHDRLQEVTVLPYEQVLAYVDGELAERFGPGRHAVHVEGRVVELVRVDLREQELLVVGQEVMTADKVSLRLSVRARFRIVDPASSRAAVTDLRDALYGEAQLAARRCVAGLTLDRLLEERVEAADRMRAEVAPRAASWGVELVGLDLKDLVLPGDLKVILNQVIEAEKRAAANVVLRREEIAATRSLANTAKLLEQNPVLVRLKELESLERLAEKVGQVTVVATPDQLLGTLRLPG